jgi:hypothetical protein
MKKSSLTAAASIVGLALVLLPADLEAAELQILGGGGAMTAPLRELGLCSPEPEPDRSADTRHARYATDHSPEQGPSLPTLNVLMLCGQPVHDRAAIDVSAFEPTDIRTATGAPR